MKKSYEVPQAIFFALDAKDILTASGGDNETPDEPNPFMIVN